MKSSIIIRFQLICIIIFAGQIVNGQILLKENFEGASFPPSGWTLQNGSVGNNWSQNTSSLNAVSGTKSMQVLLGVNYPNAWAITPALTLSGGSTYRISYWYKTNNATYLKTLNITAGYGASIAGQSVPLHNYTAINNTSFLEGIDTYTAPYTGSFWFGFNGTYPWNSGGGDLFVDSIVIQKLVLPCAGVPSIGAATGPSTICSGVSFNISLAGVYDNSGLGFQWQSSPAGANNFTNIIGAVTQTISLTQTTSKDYRCILTCSNSGLSATSNVLPVVTPAFCYCAPTFICSASWIITNVNFAGINNTTTCINDAYGDYTASVPAGNVTGGTTVPVSVAVGPGGPNYVTAWIDYNQDGTFDSSEYKYIGSGNSSTINGSIFIPSTAAAGNTRIRFRLHGGSPFAATEACTAGSYTETEDYSLNITPAKIAIIYTPFKDTLYDPTVKITANIKQIDVGINTVDPLMPRIWAKRYGTTNWKSFKGMLVSGNSNNGNWKFVINHDTLGVRKNGCDSIVYYFVAQDLNSPINLGYLPEPGTLHTSVANQVTPAPVPFGYRIKPRLKDTIYVSQSDCRYTSLSSENMLFEQINARKLEGNLTVIIEGDIYERGVNDVKGVSLNGHSLTIRPDGNTVRNIYSEVDVSTGYGNISAIKLNGVNNVTIDGSYNGSGRFLHFINTSSTYLLPDTSCNIKVFNSCNGVVIKNIFFQQDRYAQNDGEASIFLAQGVNTNISILNNKFSNITAASMSDRHISSLNGNNTVTIRGNEFDNFRESAIRIFTACDNWVIDSNHFYRTTVPSDYSYDWAAINVIGGGHTISNNYIGGQAPFCTGLMTFIDNPSGLLAPIKVLEPGGTNPVIISGNRIDNIKTTNTYSAQSSMFSGIYAYNNNCIIHDNVIGNPLSTTPTIAAFADAVNGITSIGDKPVEIRNNKISGLTTVDDANGFHGVVTMYGIYRANNGNGWYVYTSPSIISNNIITNLLNLRNKAAYSQYEDLGGTAGISVNGGSQNIIEQNELHNFTIADNVVGGIVFTGGYSAAPSIIQRNRIYDLANTTYGLISGIGIDGDTAGVNIINNQLSLTNRNIANYVEIKGIYEDYNSGITPRQRILYNSIYIGGTANAASTSGSCAFYSRYLPVKEIYNNIFYNERTGGTGHYAYRFFDGPIGEHFNYLKAGNNLFVVTDTAFFGQTSETTYRGWLSWKAFTQNDSSSYVTLPAYMPAAQFFADKDNGNLNVNTANDICWYAHGKAKPFNGVADDFGSNNIRSVSIATGATDIGSDEFVTTTVPPVLTVYGRHIPGGADTLSCNGRIMGIITWGNTGTLPTLGNCRWYSGEWPNDPTNNGTVPNARYMNAYWVIPVTGGSGYNYSLTLSYDSSILGKIIRTQDMIINKKQIAVPGTWNVVSPTIVSGNAQTLTINNQASFSEFTATDLLAPIPLDLILFNGQRSGKDINLNWTVENASNDDYFEIEKSVDGANFNTIGKVFSTYSQDYHFTDNGALVSGNPAIYYRLKVVTKSNNVFYSNILQFKMETSTELDISSVYPNPFTNNIGIVVTSPVTQLLTLRIMDIDGRVVYQSDVKILSGSNLIDINKCTELSKGSYILEIVSAHQTYHYSILKM